MQKKNTLLAGDDEDEEVNADAVEDAEESAIAPEEGGAKEPLHSECSRLVSLWSRAK